jgi:hypothetical protein
MKNVRLIKRDHLPERKPTPRTTDTPSTTINQAVKAVRTWVQEQRNTQQQARQVFAALFTLPQS